MPRIIDGGLVLAARPPLTERVPLRTATRCVDLDVAVPFAPVVDFVPVVDFAPASFVGLVTGLTFVLAAGLAVVRAAGLAAVVAAGFGGATVIFFGVTLDGLGGTAGV